ncbi:MAG: SDR family oxidoreductase [Acidimicrobiales bacterium]
MGRLEGKHAVITGAAGGMGRVAVRVFCEEGARVLGADIDEAAGEVFAKEMVTGGMDYRFKAVDVTSATSVQALADFAKAEFGAVDALYNNAGVILGKALMETTEEDWNRVEAINSKSVFLMTKAFVPLMAGRKGSIINVSSLGGIVAFDKMAAYGAAKAACAHFSRVAAVELAPGIRVNAICPGVIDTPMPHAFTSDMPDKEAVLQSWRDAHLLGRFGRPEEVVSLALWLASDEAGFMTGAVLPIDGGYSTV